MNQDLSEKVLEARAKLAEKFGDSVRLGGKGTQRRKKKTVHKTTINDDKKLKSVVKKFGVQPLVDIEEVNMFKDDNTVIHFSRPEVLASLPSNTFVVIGAPETKNLFPNILQHLGPKQLEGLKSLISDIKPKDKIEETNEEDEDDVPNLVTDNFEEVSKKE